MIRRLLAAALCAVAAPVDAQDMPSSLYPLGGMIQMETVMLDASGNATMTFVSPFPVPPLVAHFPKSMDLVNPLICNWTSVTASSASIHCWRTTLLGLLTNLLGGSVTGGQVTIIARAAP